MWRIADQPVMGSAVAAVSAMKPALVPVTYDVAERLRTPSGQSLMDCTFLSAQSNSAKATRSRLEYFEGMADRLGVVSVSDDETKCDYCDVVVLTGHCRADESTSYWHGLPLSGQLRDTDASVGFYFLDQVLARQRGGDGAPLLFAGLVVGVVGSVIQRDFTTGRPQFVNAHRVCLPSMPAVGPPSATDPRLSAVDGRGFRVMFVCGPYYADSTTTMTLLTRIVDLASQRGASLLVIGGPFLSDDETHDVPVAPLPDSAKLQQVRNSSAIVDAARLDAADHGIESYLDRLSSIIGHVSAQAARRNEANKKEDSTKPALTVGIVPDTGDVTEFPFLPQRSFNIDPASAGGLLLLPNPSHITVGGCLRLGMTTSNTLSAVSSAAADGAAAGLPPKSRPRALCESVCRCGSFAPVTTIGGGIPPLRGTSSPADMNGLSLCSMLDPDTGHAPHLVLFPNVDFADAFLVAATARDPAEAAAGSPAVVSMMRSSHPRASPNSKRAAGTASALGEALVTSVVDVTVLDVGSYVRSHDSGLLKVTVHSVIENTA